MSENVANSKSIEELIEQYPHRRFNPLSGEWIFVSPQRTKRPWRGQLEKTQDAMRPSYDPQCYLCPGNQRANGVRNPQYEHTFVFDNDFPALLPETPFGEYEIDRLLFAQTVRGTCRVICFSPRHDLTLPLMPQEEIRRVVDIWADQVKELGAKYQWVQVFENKGAVMGCSNPHPHGQIWAVDMVPDQPRKEDDNQRNYYKEYGQPLLMAYLQMELEIRERIILENDDWVVLVPYWAKWPFETLLLPRQHTLRLSDLNSLQRDNLAKILKLLLIRYDNLFYTSFPYSMGWHGAPFSVEDSVQMMVNESDPEKFAHWQLHAHFYPPLLRSATIKKFMVGYEMLAEAQRDLTAEVAAQRLRSLSNRHYSLISLSE